MTNIVALQALYAKSELKERVLVRRDKVRRRCTGVH